MLCIGNVSEAMQNLMMTHRDIRTFLKHYLSRRITVDTQAVVRGIQPQDALMRAACTMSRSIDPRRPRKLTPEQSATINDHPKVRDLLQQREELKHSLPNATKHPKYKKLNRKINQRRQRLRDALLQKVKDRWEYEQPVHDVERQIAGIEVKNEVAVQPQYAMLPVQKNLVDAIMAPPGVTLELEIRRRNRAIRAVTEYCGVEEGGMNPIRAKRRSGNVILPAKSQLEHDEEALEAAKVSVYQEKRPKRCWKCVGNPNLPIEDRVYEFSSQSDLSKHFKRKHLQYIKEGQSLRCELCKVSLANKMHLQRHGLVVHGTVT
jgi:hypothetical protein